MRHRLFNRRCSSLAGYLRCFSLGASEAPHLGALFTGRPACAKDALCAPRTPCECQARPVRALCVFNVQVRRAQKVLPWRTLCVVFTRTAFSSVLLPPAVNLAVCWVGGRGAPVLTCSSTPYLLVPGSSDPPAGFQRHLLRSAWPCVRGREGHPL